MFIIIEYIIPNYDKVCIVNEDGEPIIFGSRHSAKNYAKENCTLYYKIVEL